MQNMKMKIGIVVLVVLIGGSIAIFLRTGNASSITTPTTSAPNETTNPVTTTTTPGTTKTPATKSYSMTEVATHINGSSCWTAINGNVYDVTSWINQHPGGAEAILSLCGKDGSKAFNDQHGGQRRPEAELATFKIGVLK